MSITDPWSELRREWTHIQLPGYRKFGPHATYQSFSFSDLPPIPIDLDDSCNWLLQYGTKHGGSLDQYERDLQPSEVVELAAAHNLKLPNSFEVFMTSHELQSRVRSCTDCYLDPGKLVVETFGLINGT